MTGTSTNQDLDVAQLDLEQLKPYAKKYIWWKTADEAIQQPERVIAQVMDIGDFEDALNLRELVGDGVFRNVLTNAQAGWFNARSWNYWHHRLGLAKLGPIPALPTRKFDRS